MLRVESRGRMYVVKKCVIFRKDSVVMIGNLFSGIGCKIIPMFIFPELPRTHGPFFFSGQVHCYCIMWRIFTYEIYRSVSKHFGR
jgi:hypothetical protein